MLSRQFTSDALSAETNGTVVANRASPLMGDASCFVFVTPHIYWYCL